MTKQHCWHPQTCLINKDRIFGYLVCMCCHLGCQVYMGEKSTMAQFCHLWYSSTNYYQPGKSLTLKVQIMVLTNNHPFQHGLNKCTHTQRTTVVFAQLRKSQLCHKKLFLKSWQKSGIKRSNNIHSLDHKHFTIFIPHESPWEPFSLQQQGNLCSISTTQTSCHRNVYLFNI